MNEALQQAHKLVLDQGYAGTLDDYKNLLSSSNEAFTRSYDLAKGKGYTGSMEDFAELIQVQIPAIDLKKKDDGDSTGEVEGVDSSGIDLEDGALLGSIADSIRGSYKDIVTRFDLPNTFEGQDFYREIPGPDTEGFKIEDQQPLLEDEFFQTQENYKRQEEKFTNRVVGHLDMMDQYEKMESGPEKDRIGKILEYNQRTLSKEMDAVQDLNSQLQRDYNTFKDGDAMPGLAGDMVRGMGGFGELVDDMYRDLRVGGLSGRTVPASLKVMTNGKKASPEEIDKFMKRLEEMEGLVPSESIRRVHAYKDEHGDTAWNTFMAYMKHPDALPALAMDSLGKLVNTASAKNGLGTWASTMAAYTATGASVGAAGGSFVPLIGNVAGGAGGAAAGLTTGFFHGLGLAFGAASGTMEVGFSFAEFLREELGDKEINEENIRNVLEDEAAFNRIKGRALTRGITIGAVDAFTSFIGAKVGASMFAKSTSRMGKLKGVVAATGIEMAGGSAGEAAAMLMADQELSPFEIITEGLAEGPMAAGPITMAIGKAPKYMINGSQVSRQELMDLIRHAHNDDILGMDIDVVNDNRLKTAVNNKKKRIKIDREIDPAIKGDTRDEIIELEMKKDKLGQGITLNKKERIKAIEAEIREKQESYVQKQSAEAQTMEGEAGAGSEVGATDSSDGSARAAETEDAAGESSDEAFVKTQAFAEEIAGESGTITDASEQVEGSVKVEVDGVEAVLSRKDGDYVLESIRTQPDQRGQGKAEALMQRMIGLADQEGAGIELRIAPEDSSTNKDQLRGWYERHGFNAISEDRMYREPQERLVQRVSDDSGLTLNQYLDSIKEKFPDATPDTVLVNGKKVEGDHVLSAEDQVDLTDSVAEEDVELAMQDLDDFMNQDNPIEENLRTQSDDRLSEPARGKVLVAAGRRATQALSSIIPKFKGVRIIWDEATYRKVARIPEGEPISRGSFVPYKDGSSEIVLFGKRATRRTIAHEAFHAILKSKLLDDTAIWGATMDMIEAIRHNVPPAVSDYLNDFVEAYERQGKGLQSEERLAELVGILRENFVSFSEDTRSAIRKWIDKLLQMVGIKDQVAFTNEEVIDFLETIAQKVGTGESLTEADVSLLDRRAGEMGASENDAVRRQRDVVYRQELDNRDINSLRSSIRMKWPDSYIRQVLDDLQEAKKNDDLVMDDQVNMFLDNGITLNDVGNMLIEDGLVDDAAAVKRYFGEIGGINSEGIFRRLNGLKSLEGKSAESIRRQMDYSVAPNGKESILYKSILNTPDVAGDINLANEIMAKVDSDEFKTWFGDSKVVDENGQPLIVFHGTMTQGLEEFSLDKVGENTDDPGAMLGFHFAVDESVAKNFAETIYTRNRAAGEIHPVFLRLENPVSGFLSEESLMDSKKKKSQYEQDVKKWEEDNKVYDQERTKLDDKWFKREDAYHDPKVETVPEWLARKKSWEEEQLGSPPVRPFPVDVPSRMMSESDVNFEFFGNPFVRMEGGNKASTRLRIQSKVNEYRKRGFDGFGYHNEITEELAGAKNDETLVVFDPEQVKSVFNDGSWSVDEAAMRRRLDERLAEPGVEVGGNEKATQKVNPKGEAFMMDKINQLLDQYPDALRDRGQWKELMSRVVPYTSEDGKKVLIPAYPENLGKMAQSVEAVIEELKMVSPEQRKMASDGLAGTKEIGKLYKEGKMDETDTALYFLWNILSIGLSPYPQESAFLKAIDNGVTEFMDKVTNGTFLSGNQITYTFTGKDGKTIGRNVDSGIVEYFDWVDRTLDGDGPYAGAKANLRAFGRTFLAKASQIVEYGEFKGKTKLAALHEILSDRKTPTNELRRKWHANMSKMQFNNKIFDFILLTTGRDDLFVVDRVRVEHFWGKEFTESLGLKDPDTSIYDGSELKYKKSNSAGYSKVLEDVPGMVFVELANRTMRPLVQEAYKRMGVKENADLGRFHWETWVAASSQEVTHGSIDAVVQNKTEGEITDAGIRQGKYGAWDFNFRYRKQKGKEFKYEFSDHDGNVYIFDDLAPIRDEIQTQNSRKTGIDPEKRFIKFDPDGEIIKRKTGKSKDQKLDRGWYDYPGVDTERYFEFLKGQATEVREAIKRLEDPGDVDPDGLRRSHFLPEDGAYQIVNKARAAGFSDRSIRDYLKSRGFTAEDIASALDEYWEIGTILPPEFASYKSGMTEGMALFGRVMDAVRVFAYTGPRGGKRKTRVRSYADMRREGHRIIKGDPYFYHTNPRRAETVRAEMDAMGERNTQEYRDLAMELNELTLSDLEQKELLIALDRAMSIKHGPKDVKEAMHQLRTELRTRRIGRRDLAAIQKQLRLFIRANLPGTNIYNRNEVNRLIRIVQQTSEVTLLQDSEVVMKTILDVQTRMRNKILDQAHRLAKRKAKKSRTPAGRPKTAGVDAEGQVFFQQLAKVLDAVMLQIRKKDPTGLDNIFNELLDNADIVRDAVSKEATGQFLGTVINDKGQTKNEMELLMLDRAFNLAGQSADQNLEAVKDIFNEIKIYRAESLRRLTEARLKQSEKNEKIYRATRKSLMENFGEILFDYKKVELRPLKNRIEVAEAIDAVETHLGGPLPDGMAYIVHEDGSVDTTHGTGYSGNLRDLSPGDIVVSMENNKYKVEEVEVYKKTKSDLSTDRANQKKRLQQLKVWAWGKEFISKWKQNPINAFRRFQGLQHLGTLCRSLDEKGTFWVDNVYRPLTRMHSKALQGKRQMIMMMDNMASMVTINGKRAKSMARILLELDKRGLHTIAYENGNHDTMTQAQWMSALARSRNEIQMDKLKNRGWTDQTVSEIEAMLGEDVVRFMDAVVDFLSTTYFNRINEEYIKVNHVSLNYVPNYFPTSTESRASEQALREGDFSSVFNAQYQSHTRNRTDVNGEIVLGQDAGDFFRTLDQYFENMEFFVSHANGVKNINAIFRHPSAKKALREFGTEKVFVQSVNYALNPNAFRKEIPTTANWAMTALQQMVLNFKAIQAFKQMTSFINAFANYSYFGPKETVTINNRQEEIDKAFDRGFFSVPIDFIMFGVDMAHTILTYRKQFNRAMKLSPDFRSRVEAAARGDIFTLNQGTQADKLVAGNKYWRAWHTAGAAPTTFGDIAGVSGYLINLKRDLANGVPLELALERFHEYNETQQSRRRTEMNSWQQNPHVGMRFAVTFMSTPLLQINKVMSNFPLLPRNINKAKAWKEFTLNYAIANTFFVLASNIVKLMAGDDEDKTEVYEEMGKALAGVKMMAAIPFFGAAIEEIVDRHVLDRNPWSRGGGVNPYNKFIQAANKGEVEEFVKTGIGMALGTGIDPWVGLWNLFNKDGDHMEDVTMMLGISPSYRPNEFQKEQKKKSSSSSGPSKTELRKRAKLGDETAKQILEIQEEWNEFGVDMSEYDQMQDEFDQMEDEMYRDMYSY